VGVVPGTILNRFSMSDYDEHFRIATSIGTSSNNVYILDSEMKTVGKLEGLAPGEQLHSARFMGNKGYLVTFQKIDPLFVIDLSEPSAPVVLGELKIPGYSDYLHPYDETHLIGIGKNTVTGNDTGTFSWFQGIKVAIFDVSDVNHPIELHQVVIGERGSDSLALTDPKSFLFSKEKNLFVLPISLAEFATEPTSPSTYGKITFQGSYVYNLNLETGFQYKGRVTHNDPVSSLQSRHILRNLYIENALYTLSSSRLKVNDLNTMEQLQFITF